MELERKVSVYELAQQAQGLLAIGSNGFDTDEELADWQAQMQAWMERSGDKFVACRVVIERAEAEEKWLREQSSLLADRARRFAKVQENVKALATGLLEAREDISGDSKVQTADGSSAWLVRREDVQVEATDIDAVPSDLVRVKVELDKSAVKKALKEGRNVPGISITVINSTSIRFGK